LGENNLGVVGSEGSWTILEAKLALNQEGAELAGFQAIELVWDMDLGSLTGDGGGGGAASRLC